MEPSPGLQPSDEALTCASRSWAVYLIAPPAESKRCVLRCCYCRRSASLGQLMAGFGRSSLGRCPATDTRSRVKSWRQIFPGSRSRVAVDGKLVWSEAFGYADVEAKRQTTTRTQFQNRKRVEAARRRCRRATLRERQSWISTSPSSAVPSFPIQGTPITARAELGGHLAGIPARLLPGQRVCAPSALSVRHCGTRAVFQNDSLVAAAERSSPTRDYGF